MKLTKYQQSCFLIELEGKRILIDPGRYVFDERFTPNEFKNIDVLLITHVHSDHCLLSAIKRINKNNKLVILTNKPVHDLLKEENIESEILEPGQEKKINGLIITGIKAVHGYLPDGSRKPEVIAFLINDKVYHATDTIYLEKKPYADVVLVPVCGRVVMDVWDAAKFVDEIGCKLAIPMHYTNPAFPVNPHDLEKELKNIGSKVEARVLKDRETIEI